MAIKYFCDGCDKNIPDDRYKSVTVSITTREDTAPNGGQYHLCEGCARSLVSQANPRNWARCVAA